MLYAIVAVLAIILDQAVKYWTTVNIVVDTGEAKLIPGLIHFANVHNTGAAFSFLSGARWFFVILCIIFVLAVIYALSKDLITGGVCRWAAVFVLAGAIGNCIDRIVCGYVVDMFEFEFFRFPVFNVADIFITLGVIVFCIALLLEKPAGKKPAKAAETDGSHAPKQEKPVKAPKAEAPQAEPAAAKEPAPARKPAPRRRQKTEIPTFPKRDLPQAPAMDPNDPFAEWEKRANAPKAETAPSNTTVYTQPAAAVPVPAAEQPAVPVVEIPVVEVPAAPVPAAEVPVVEVPASPAPAASAADEFDLESILAEFKDL